MSISAQMGLINQLEYLFSLFDSLQIEKNINYDNT